MLSRPTFISRGLSVAILAGMALGLGACSTSRGYSDQAQLSTQSLPPQPRESMYARPYGDNYLPPRANPDYAGPNGYQNPPPRPAAGMMREPARPYGDGYSLGSSYEPPRAGEYRWNGNPNRVQEGAAPPNMTPPPAPVVAANGARTVTVRPGDTLFSLSRHYGVSVAALAEQNRLDGTAIHSGQTLALPPSAR